MSGTVLVASGDSADVAAMLTLVGPLSVNGLVDVAGERFARLPEPSVDDFGRWVFPGVQPDVFPLAKMLSRAYPLLDWECFIPANSMGDCFRYFLRDGVGVAERTSVVSPDDVVGLPAGAVLMVRYVVAEQANVFEAAFVVLDGKFTDVTDDYLGRTGRATVKSSLTTEATYDDEDLAAMLGNAC